MVRTKLFLDLYLTKFLESSTKLFFRVRVSTVNVYGRRIKIGAISTIRRNEHRNL